MHLGLNSVKVKYEMNGKYLEVVKHSTLTVLFACKIVIDDVYHI